MSRQYEYQQRQFPRSTYKKKFTLKLHPRRQKQFLLTSRRFLHLLLCKFFLKVAYA